MAVVVACCRHCCCIVVFRLLLVGVGCRRCCCLVLLFDCSRLLCAFVELGIACRLACDGVANVACLLLGWFRMLLLCVVFVSVLVLMICVVFVAVDCCHRLVVLHLCCSCC